MFEVANHICLVSTPHVQHTLLYYKSISYTVEMTGSLDSLEKERSSGHSCKPLNSTARICCTARDSIVHTHIHPLSEVPSSSNRREHEATNRLIWSSEWKFRHPRSSKSLNFTVKQSTSMYKATSMTPITYRITRCSLRDTEIVVGLIMSRPRILTRTRTAHAGEELDAVEGSCALSDAS